jgi:hypothetical protein
MSVDAGSDDPQQPQFGKALYDFTAGGDEEVFYFLSLSRAIFCVQIMNSTKKSFPLAS